MYAKPPYCTEHRGVCFPGTSLSHSRPKKPLSNTRCRPQQSWNCKYPIRTFSKTLPWLPSSHLCADAHPACASSSSPSPSRKGQWAAAQLQRLLPEQLIWYPSSQLFSELQALEICVCTCVRIHTHMSTRLLWGAQSSKKCFLSILALSNFGYFNTSTHLNYPLPGG